MDIHVPEISGKQGWTGDSDTKPQISSTAKTRKSNNRCCKNGIVLAILWSPADERPKLSHNQTINYHSVNQYINQSIKQPILFYFPEAEMNKLREEFGHQQMKLDEYEALKVEYDDMQGMWVIKTHWNLWEFYICWKHWDYFLKTGWQCFGL